MRKSFALQFRISFLLLLTAIVAVGCACYGLSLPFRPTVTVSNTESSYFLGADGETERLSTITITNTGAATLWYHGSDNTLEMYWVVYDPSSENAHASKRSHSGADWLPLYRGESARLKFASTDARKVCVAFSVKDWRNREATGMTDCFDIESKFDTIGIKWRSDPTEFMLW